jgi:hypothetical protein
VGIITRAAASITDDSTAEDALIALEIIESRAASIRALMRTRGQKCGYAGCSVCDPDASDWMDDETSPVSGLTSTTISTK